ncbi:hypothetical protein AVEN_27548-1 [Araneus ventricosus]|uniref:Uncharacterized protein n=1 Tax=Araneus ventricosus TaxID=182803 RepID=A0A4Y2TR00_ARAVE|nr:hypothetical protein AVEN_27548-1 [Araneus ventricosus]
MRAESLVKVEMENGIIWFGKRKAELEKERVKKPMPASPNTKCVVRYGSEIYAKEFSKYLNKFTNEQAKRKILDKLYEKGICDELRALNVNGEYVINKKLVKFIMKNIRNISKNLDYNWKTVEEAILKAENSFLKRRKMLREIMMLRRQREPSRTKRFSG